MPDSFEFDPAPGATRPTHEYGTPVGTAGYQDQFLTEAVQELLASTVAYRQRGVTLAGGQGVLPTGTVLAQDTTSGKYYVHTSAGSNGRQVALGILRDSRNTTPNGVATDCQGNLVWSGALNASLISGTDTSSLVTGLGGGIGSGANGAWTSLLGKGRLMTGNSQGSSNSPAFSGSPFDSSEGNIFVFLWFDHCPSTGPGPYQTGASACDDGPGVSPERNKTVSLRYAPRHATAPQPVVCVPGAARMLPSAAGVTVKAVTLAPLVVMVRPLYEQAPKLQVYGGDVLGLAATLALLACLAVTPVSRLVRFKSAAAWRKWFGLAMFAIGAAGLAIAGTGGPRGQWGMRMSGHVQAWTGTVIVVALIPLAATSNTWSQKLLGAYWKTWQRRLVWAVWLVVAVHLLTLAAWRVEAAFFLASGPLLAARVPAVRKDAIRWKNSGYADSARWVLSGVAAGVFGCAAGYLLYLEVVAGVAAFRLM
jgi:methionine sulfoxide reductase heme-binding subunit